MRFRSSLTMTLATTLMVLGLAVGSFAHPGHKHVPPSRIESGTESVLVYEVVVDENTFGYYFQLFKSLIHGGPTEFQQRMIGDVRSAHSQLGQVPGPEGLATRLEGTYQQARNSYRRVHVVWEKEGCRLVAGQEPLPVAMGVPGRVLVEVENRTDAALHLSATLESNGAASSPATSSPATWIPPSQIRALPCTLTVSEGSKVDHIRLVFSQEGDDLPAGEVPAREVPAREVIVPVRLSQAGTIRGRLLDSDTGKVWPGRVYVLGSDHAYRHAKAYAQIETVSEKSLLDPSGVNYELPFFYADGTFEIKVPPGETKITLERGYEHEIVHEHLHVEPGEVHEVTLSAGRFLDMKSQGWISGDTHIHWVTNQWAVNEDLDLLRVVQRAEDIRVVNNLTLLHRTANRAFIAPSQHPMGPVPGMCNDEYHVQMGEEYRNEELYGHQCFLNIHRLVLPISTGNGMAGPDAPDYPINKTAILDCRSQGGINIEAHSLGLNWDVPVNVIHGLTDSLDQMGPTQYYRFLNCGFRVPLSNGSDHPARLAGSARVYVKVDGPFSYEKWIEGIRRCRTFTSSGPLLFLEVNEADIGDELDVPPKTILTVHAKVRSRKPIGTFQVVSNGEVLREIQVDGTEAELSFEIAADEPRWIVARCSPHGSYSAIAADNTAHTSAIYVDVAGKSVFDSEAAQFWMFRMHQHAQDIAGRGVFATDQQREEAVGYIEEGIEMYKKLIETKGSVE